MAPITKGQKRPPQTKNPLRSCWNKQVRPVQETYVRFSYIEHRHELEHNTEPWQQTPYEANGIVWVNAKNFRQRDTLRSLSRNRTYFAKTQASDQHLLLLRHGEDKLAAVSPAMMAEQLLHDARYSPVNLLNYFYQHHILADDTHSSLGHCCYTTSINQALVRLFIRRSDSLLDSLTILKADDMLGDLTTTITYQKYSQQGQVQHPLQINIDKVNGRLHDKITLSQLSTVTTSPILIDSLTTERALPEELIQPTAQLEAYNDRIHFINLPHTDDKVMLVEFTDFILVAEAPLSSENGALIIQQVHRLIPGKPIRYFVFGHHHPHYLGGVRPFVHEGATILCSAGNEDYVSYLAKAPHRLKPDSLALDPKPLRLEPVGAHKMITDGQFRMDIYHIGNQSAHTSDYLIYYFPTEQLVFQDDLVWLPKTGPVSKASMRQAGLYQAIKNLNIPVRTIVQSWPLSNAKVKTTFSFSELENSVQGN